MVSAKNNYWNKSLRQAILKLYCSLNIVILGERQSFAVQVCSGQEGIKAGKLTVSSLSEGLEFPKSSQYTGTIKGDSNGKYMMAYCSKILFETNNPSRL
jgi:hypothetical protein